ncbi:MAG TPA: hypothetical protein VM145_03500 [Sphingomicrobium sp.]|nr:hypothetical protein [Sphingomicrobium sp.]
MTRQMIMLAATAAATAGFAALPSPAAAQKNSVAEIIVFGTDPCPRSTDDQIVVCRRVPETYRYRLPEAYRPNGTPQQSDSWTNKAKVLETVGSTGINSCSPVGPGGYTGCLTRVIREAREQRKQSNEDSTPPQ